LAEYDIPTNCRYSEEDEWARQDGDRLLVGITDYAQSQLGDIVYVELPKPGTTVEQGDTFGTVESVKTVADLYAPVAGEVVEVNIELADNPEQVNEDCYGDGWMVALSVADSEEYDALLDAAAYLRHVESRED
jgi:glycine cleavage system H protein